MDLAGKKLEFACQSIYQHLRRAVQNINPLRSCLDTTLTHLIRQCPNIPGAALAVGGGYVNTSVLSHEFGHCLGLYHTHSGRGCGDNANCSENVNESSCSICEDLVCDSPTDPCLSGNVDLNCQYIGPSGFTPDVHNIMSYAPPACLNRLTTGQVQRMHTAILNNSIISDRSFLPTIVSSSNPICSTSIFSIPNLPTGVIITSWGSSNTNGLSINSTTRAATRLNNFNGPVTISATVSSSCGSVSVPPLSVWVGSPKPGPLSQNINNQPFCSGTEKSVSIAPEIGATSYIWSSNNESILLVDGFSISAIIDAGNPGTCSFTVTNNCGTTSQNYFAVVSDCSGGGGEEMLVYSNPASSMFSVQVMDSISEKDHFARLFQVTLINRYSQTVFSAQATGRNFQIPMDALPPVVYSLDVFYKDVVL